MRAGLRGISSGELLPSGDRGERRLAELARRDGAAPLKECNEFSEAFRRSVGVPERDGVVPLAEAPLRGFRIELPGRGVLGDLVTEGLKGPAVSGLEERGDFAGEAVDMASWFKDCTRSPSATPLSFRTGWSSGAETFLGGDADLREGDAIVSGRLRVNVL